MKKYFAAIAIVVLFAFGLSALAQEKTPPPAKPDKPAAQGPLSRVKEALQLTPEQETKLKEFAKARQEENKAFNEQMKKMRTDMQALRNDPKADPNKVNGLIDQMFKFQADRAKAQFKNQKDREKIFTPEQLEKMKNGRQMLMRGGMRGGFMGGPGGMRFGRGMMMRGPMMRFGLRMGLMQRFMPRLGDMFRFGRMGRHFGPGRGMGMMMRRPGGQRGPASEAKKPEVKK
jgi:Spy/CpxP family protein refolding chaperone